MDIKKILVTLSLLIGVAQAQRVALVLGNDIYSSELALGEGINLKNAGRDSDLVALMLEKQLGFDEIVHRKNVDRKGLMESVYEFSALAKGAEVALVYYAGHGMESFDGDANYLLPTDVVVEEVVESDAALAAGGVRVDDIIRKLKKAAPEGAKLILMDCCRERPKNRSLAGVKGGGLMTYEQVPSGTLVMLAASPGKIASDGNEHGPFTQALQKYLPNPGVNLMESFQQISDHVVKVSKGTQIPWLKADGNSQIFQTTFLLNKGEKIEALPKAIKSYLFPARKNGRYGFINQRGEFVIMPKWDYAEPFHEGLAKVKINKKYGFVSQKGEIIIEPEWDSASEFSGGLAKVKRYGILAERTYYINKKGEKVIALPSRYKYAGTFTEGLALTEYAEDSWGFINKSGEMAIFVDSNRKGEPHNYEGSRACGMFSDGLAVVKKEVGFRNHYGYINKAGKEVIPVNWSSAYPFSEGLAKVGDSDFMYGYINKSGKEVIQPQWPSAGCFSEGMAMVGNSEGLWGYINKEGKLIIQFTWDYADEFSEGFAGVKNAEGYWGFINKGGEVVMPFKWKRVFPFSNGLAWVESVDGYWGYIDTNGFVVHMDS